MPEGQQQLLAWTILWLAVLWTYLWKCIAFWMAGRRRQLGWYVVLAALPLDFGALAMVYVFLVAPRHPEGG
jgi:hypothetical protein